MNHSTSTTRTEPSQTHRSSPQRTRLLLFALLTVTLLLLTACPFKRIGFQGRLLDANGNPLNGTVDFKFEYWTVPTNTDPDNMLYSYTENDVQVVNGLFDVPIGPASADPGVEPDPAIFARQLYVQIYVNGEKLNPRQPLTASPYAMSLIGGAVVSSIHEGNGVGGNDDTSANYATFTVLAGGTNGTALGIKSAENGGDLIRACTGPVDVIVERNCGNLRFRVENNGDVSADGSYTSPAADFAELIDVSATGASYEPGDVLVISAAQDRAVELATEPNSTAVIGVYSTKPALLGGATEMRQANGDAVPVGIVGIVPVKVTAENGPIQRGDLLTTSSIPGHTMLATEYTPGAILGKAMGELESGEGVIEVVLLLQ